MEVLQESVAARALPELRYPRAVLVFGAAFGVAGARESSHLTFGVYQDMVQIL